MTLDNRLEQRVSDLRRDFDQAFARDPITNSEGVEDLLSVRVHGDPFALKLRELAGLVPNKKVVPLPGGGRELLGIAGIRGGLVPVYSLAVLLGYGLDVDANRWLVLCNTKTEPVGLSFGTLEGHLRLPASHLHAATQEGESRQHIKEMAREKELMRPVISISSILETIETRRDLVRARKEP